MPANLTPQYRAAEERFRSAKSSFAKVACLEEMLAVMPKHKGTDKLKAELRGRIARLRDDLTGRDKAARRHDTAFDLPRQGDARVVVAGPANSGKSLLVRCLTNAQPAVADYPMTTRTPTPGMMAVDKVKIQVVDTPPLDGAYVDPGLIPLIRHADLLLATVDIRDDPAVRLSHAARFLRQYRIALCRPRTAAGKHTEFAVLPCLVAVNKCDCVAPDACGAILSGLDQTGWTAVAVSAAAKVGLDKLKGAVLDSLAIVRVYAKPPGREPDRDAPVVLRSGATVEDFAAALHQDLARRMQEARVRSAASRDWRIVQRDQVLDDGDEVELVLGGR